MSNRTLTDKEKQFTVLPGEAAPKEALTKAHLAVSKALSQVKKTKSLKK